MDEAIACFRKAIELDPKLAAAHNNLGDALADKGQLDEAIACCKKAIELDPKFAPAHGNLMEVYRNAGKLDLALNQFQELLAHTSVQDRQQVPAQIARLGYSLLQARAYADAEPILRECLIIREKMQPDVWSTFNTKSQLGGALLGQKKYAEAEPLLLAGYEGLKQRENATPEGGKTALPEAMSAGGPLRSDREEGRGREVADKADPQKPQGKAPFGHDVRREKAVRRSRPSHGRGLPADPKLADDLSAAAPLQRGLCGRAGRDRSRAG